MTIETGALEQGYAKLETAYNEDPAATLAATDAVAHLELTLTSKNNREPSPEKRGTPDEAQSLPRRPTHSFDFASVMWEPSGTPGTESNVAKFLKAGMGDQNTLSLATTVAASPAATATGCDLVSVTGLAVNDLVVFDMDTAGHKEVTRVKTISVWTVTPPTALTAALAAAGAGNVDNGTHSYKVTFVRATSPLETVLGSVSVTVTVVDKTTDGKVALSAIPTGPAGTTDRKIYRTTAGNAVTGPWKLLTTIAGNVTTTYTDNTADSGLGVTGPTGAITYDALSAAPDTPGAVQCGISFKQISTMVQSFAIYKYYNAGGFSQSVRGAIINHIQASFDGTREVLLALSGPAGSYQDNSTIPDAPTAALAGLGAGNVESGTHSYLVVFGRNSAPAKGQMGVVSGVVTTTGGDGQVAVSAIPLGPTGTVRRYLYRSEAGNAVTGPWKLLTTIEDNITTIFADNVADGSLGATALDLEVQAKPAAFTVVGAPCSGLVGTVYVDGHEFPVISATVTVENNEELRNKELGYPDARGIAGRTAMRRVTVSFTVYLEDLTVLKQARNSARSSQSSVLRLLVGDTPGEMVACVAPKVEYEIPDVGNEIGPKNITFNGVAYATDGNDQVVFAEL